MTRCRGEAGRKITSGDQEYPIALPRPYEVDMSNNQGVVMPHKYNPDQHQRRSIRLRGWNYTRSGAYFITLCTHQRKNLFDDPILHELAENAWRNIPQQTHAGHVSLDEWVVMPNHLHGILVLTDETCRGEAGRKGTSLANDVSFDLPRPYRMGLNPVQSGRLLVILNLW